MAVACLQRPRRVTLEPIIIIILGEQLPSKASAAAIYIRPAGLAAGLPATGLNLTLRIWHSNLAVPYLYGAVAV